MERGKKKNLGNEEENKRKGNADGNKDESGMETKVQGEKEA